MCCTPALETITSTPPSSRAQRDTPASTWSSRVTSMAMPRPRSSRAAASAPAAFTSATQTRAPSRANACAIARPMPLAAPVTSATLPERRMESSLARGTIPCRDARRVVGSASHVGRVASPGCIAIVPGFSRARPRGPLGGGRRDPRHPRSERGGEDDAVQLPVRVLQPTEGTVELFGETIAGLPPHKIVDRGLSRSFQISSVFETLTVLENLVVALQARTGHPVRFWEPREALREFEPRARKIAEQVRLNGKEQVRAADLSHGQKRNLEIGISLTQDPRVLLLDEPTSGMGREDVERTVELAREVAKGRTVVFVEHNMGVVAKLAHRITVLARGQVLAAGSYEQIRNDPRVIEAYLGEEVRA